MSLLVAVWLLNVYSEMYECPAVKNFDTVPHVSGRLRGRRS